MIPLTLMDSMESAYIARLSGTPEMRKHLADMGFVHGAEVALVSTIGGNVIVNVKGTRVAIGERLARKIFVEENPTTFAEIGCSHAERGFNHGEDALPQRGVLQNEKLKRR